MMAEAVILESVIVSGHHDIIIWGAFIMNRKLCSDWRTEEIHERARSFKASAACLRRFNVFECALLCRRDCPVFLISRRIHEKRQGSQVASMTALRP